MYDYIKTCLKNILFIDMEVMKYIYVCVCVCEKECVCVKKDKETCSIACQDLLHKFFFTFFANITGLPGHRNKRKSVFEITKMYYF